VANDNLDPSRTCLLFFDCSKLFVNGPTLDPKGRSAAVTASVENWKRQLATARELGMMVAYANTAHRKDEADYWPRITDVDWSGKPLPEGVRLPMGRTVYGAPDVEVIDDLAPLPSDYVVFKPRWNPFFQTNLELSLRTRNVDTVIVNGGNIEIGIATTCYATQVLDFNVVVVSDACNSDRADCREILMTRIFPLIGRVRTTDQVITMLRAGATQ
jgi:nicotinamidase-related amidase